MRRIAILLLSTICLAIQAQAQTFTQHIQQKEPGKGSVKITQSKEIENLVNGAAQKNVTTPATEQGKAAQTATTQSKTAATVKPQGKASPTPTPQKQNPVTTKKEKPDTGNYIGAPKHYGTEATAAEREKALKEKEKEAAKEAERKHAEAEKKETDEEMSIPTIDMRKKVMRHAKKVTGYRVQAYAGGNTRADKQKAQQIGDAIKMRFPDQPVYVHFYSPRWICRVGNYRSYSEASHMLTAIKKMGYKGATVVKGKITVFE